MPGVTLAATCLGLSPCLAIELLGPSSLAFPGSALAAAVGGFDNDGIPDLAVGKGSHPLAVRLGDGYGGIYRTIDLVVACGRARWSEGRDCGRGRVFST